jgi:copper resistance protein D
MAIVQISYTGCNCAILMSTVGLTFREVMGAQFFIASSVTVFAAVMLAATARLRISLWTTVPFAMAILVGSAATSHAWSRVDKHLVLSLFDLLHQGAAGVWIGGLPILLIALGVTQNPESPILIARRFSRTAVIGVAVVLFAGIYLSLSYLDKPNAVYGTTYGIMLLGKVGLFLVLLGIGALNKSVVERLTLRSSRLLQMLGRNVEVEIGIGFTVVLAAASLTSQPPAVDLPNDRLNVIEIQNRYVPRLPRFSSPSVSQLKVPDREVLRQEAEKTGGSITYVPGQPEMSPESPEGKAWSEYNHNWAGLIVFAVGIFAIASRSPRLKWARHWPLIFIGLAIFIFLRADPENWPLGPNGFWESFLEADVLQHRVFAVLVIGLAITEWRVQTNRSRWSATHFVFPGVCALGGALLFTHSHSIGNIKDATLIEWSHIPLAFVAVIAGWSRWAELRSSPTERNACAWIWPTCFAIMGTILMLYREA